MALIQAIKLIAEEGVENYILLLQRWHPRLRGVNDTLNSRGQTETCSVRGEIVNEEASFQCFLKARNLLPQTGPEL